MSAANTSRCRGSVIRGVTGQTGNFTYYMLPHCLFAKKPDTNTDSVPIYTRFDKIVTPIRICHIACFQLQIPGKTGINMATTMSPQLHGWPETGKNQAEHTGSEHPFQTDALYKFKETTNELPP